jgi:hypothetical protein
MIERRHSIFGDYILGGKTPPPPNAGLKEARTEIADYNTLWEKYTSEVVSKWGISSLPTEKGFSKWLQKQIEEVSNGE